MINREKKVFDNPEKEHYIYLLYIDNIVYIDKTEKKSVKFKKSEKKNPEKLLKLGWVGEKPGFCQA